MLRFSSCVFGILVAVLISDAAAEIKAQGRIVSTGEVQDIDDRWWPKEEKQTNIPTLSTTFESTTELSPEGPMQSIKNILTNPRIRGPIAVLVDTDPESLSQAQIIWEDALDDVRYLTNNAYLIAFNESERVRTLVIRNVEGLRKAILSLPPSGKREGLNNTGAVFLSMLKATQQIPPDSAILVFTSRTPNDKDLAQLAVQTLIAKRCRLYVWWSASPSINHLSVVRLFLQVAERSGGSFFHTETSESGEDDVSSHPSVNKTIMAVRRQANEYQEIPIYLDSTVQSITITIVGNISKAHLHPPEDENVINLKDPLDLRSVGAQVIHNGSALVQIYLNTSASFPGLWKLTTAGVGGASAQDVQYDVIVEGYSRLGFNPVNVDTLHNNALTGNGSPLLFNIEGDITNITGVTVLDQTGREVKTAYYRQEATTRRPDGTVSLELQVPPQELPTEPFYLQFMGHDIKGEQFTRLAYVQSAEYQQSQYLVVKLTEKSELFVLPGQMTRLYFKVTNNNSLPTQVKFACRSKFSRFINVQPYELYLQPYQTAVHVVSLQPPVLVPKGSTDSITFTAESVYARVTVPVLLNIGEKVYDFEKPTLQYTFQSNCKGTEEKDCFSKSWTVTATAQDKSSGLLSVSSQPSGIRFDSVFTIGSKDPVTFTYRATCCDSRLNLYITDTQNNTAIHSLNAYDTASSLSDGEIAAIALGVIIVIIIIVIIVVLIVRKRQRTHTFQTHQTAH
ncbi:uncharacterized protein [Anabrus simplex]|uniref:uncharacterized protein n=1 Tax=Anabrus simplex TaxID=316456 RepID=UPI0035A32371